MDPPSPTRLLFQGAHLTHIPKLLDRRQEGGVGKGNRGHWKVRWGHKGSEVGAWERRVDKRSGLMAQRTAMGEAQGVT